MFVGMLVLGQQAGTHRISAIVADPPSGTATTVAVLLILVGALSKSAQVPLHFWLPGAMAAPTPVSAYLHAASMVKAGLYLVALLAPAFSGVPGWHLTLLTLGTLTMLVGGWRALRQVDVKLLLAYGTVSQLGFLMVVLSIGSRTAALAGTAVLLAHALFKATLFLVVGVVDTLTGTRDVHKLSGVGRQLPAVAVAAALAGASMAGLPPLLGFVGKETLFTSLLHLADGETPGVPAWSGTLVLVALVAGSALTVAYTARFLWGAFATKPGVPPTPVRPLRPPFAAAPVLLAALGLGLGGAGALLTPLLSPYADLLPSGGHDEHLALWHGLGLPLLLSAVSVAVGVVRVPRPRAGVPLAGPARGAVHGRARVPVRDAARRPVGGGGHRRVPARLGLGVPRGRARGAARAAGGRARARPGHRWHHSGVVRAVGPGRPAGRGGGDGGGRGDDGALAAAAAGRGAGRRHGVRVRGAVPAARRSRHRPDPGAGRDRQPGRLRAGAAPAARLLHRPAAPGHPVLADGAGHGRRPRGRRLRRRGRRGAHGHPDLGHVPGDGVRGGLRPQRRQRDAGRHPRLGHLRGDLRPGGRGHRRGEPDLPRQPHRGHPPGARHPLPGGRREAPDHRGAPGLVAGLAHAQPRPPLDRVRGGHAPHLPLGGGVLGLPAARGAQPPRRRVRGRHGRSGSR